MSETPTGAAQQKKRLLGALYPNFAWYSVVGIQMLIPHFWFEIFVRAAKTQMGILMRFGCRLFTSPPFWRGPLTPVVREQGDPLICRDVPSVLWLVGLRTTWQKHPPYLPGNGSTGS